MVRVAMPPMMEPGVASLLPTRIGTHANFSALRSPRESAKMVPSCERDLVVADCLDQICLGVNEIMLSRTVLIRSAPGTARRQSSSTAGEALVQLNAVVRFLQASPAGWPRARVRRYGAADDGIGGGVEQVSISGRASGGHAKQGYLFRIAAKGSKFISHPLYGRVHVLHPRVLRLSERRRPGVSKRRQPVIDRNDNHVFLIPHEIRPAVDRRPGPAQPETAAIDAQHHGGLFPCCPRRAQRPNID